MVIIFSKGKRNGNRYIAFFDLDRTIIKTISGKALVRSAFKKGLMTHSGLKNAITVILSSAITPVCREVAKCLGMDDIVCTDLEVINEHYTGRSNGPPCFGEEKVSRLKKYCEKNNSTPKEAWYYGDSFSDFPVLNTVGHPVCINPDRKLKKKAIEKGWSIYYWR